MIPPKQKSTGRPPTNEYAKLDIGEYMELTETEIRQKTSGAYQYGKRHGKKFVFRRYAGEPRIYRES